MRPGTNSSSAALVVVLDALDEGGGAVADADDGDADLAVVQVAPVAGAVGDGGAVLTHEWVLPESCLWMEIRRWTTVALVTAAMKAMP